LRFTFGRAYRSARIDGNGARTIKEADVEHRACDLLLTGGVVVTMDDERRVIEPGAVAVAGDRIAAVGTPAELREMRAKRTVDAAGMAITPGFIDCHNHMFQLIARGLGEGMALWPWLASFMWPLSIQIRPEEAAAAARLASVESVRAGFTAVTDNHYAPTDADTTLAVAAALETVGLRGVVARGMMGEPTAVARKGGLAGEMFRYSADEELDITRACMQARPPGSRVAVWPAPENVVYCDQDLIRRSVELARELGTGWHTHCSEVRTDPEYYLEFYGIRPVEWLAREGLLGRGATIAHGIFLDDSEVEAIGSTATGIAYCPASHQYIAIGVMRLRDLRRVGAVVGLGTDGASGHRQDPFEQMKMAVLLQRVHSLDPTAATAEEALELATREGARYLGIDAGQIAAGRLADLAVIDLQRPHLTPRHRTVSALVYSATPADVVMTIVGGEIVYQDGACTRVDEAEVMAEAQARAGDLVRRAGLESLREPWRRTPALPA
jgi:5-methylthioadenosine/S-adenosylhomocysteine deaminase